MFSIPDPCSEDFSKMTPTERGAFCDRCSTNTWDFTRLTTAEIKHVLTSQPGKICGQVHPGQLDRVNASFIRDINQKNLQARFVLALIFAFGVSLFSCDKNDADLITSLRQIKSISYVPAFADNAHDKQGIAEFDLLNYCDRANGADSNTQRLQDDSYVSEFYDHVNSTFSFDTILPVIDIVTTKPEEGLIGIFIPTRTAGAVVDVTTAGDLQEDGFFKRLFRKNG